MNNKVKEVLSVILDKFKSGDIPEAVAIAMYPAANTPSAKWSLLNRTIMFFSGTGDARGFKQWKQVGRYVKKGVKAFSILVPCIKQETDEDDGEEKFVLKGFMASSVFRKEDTDGEPLDYEQIELPDFPLMERAQEWGLSVKAIPGNYRYYGYYSSKRKEISLATSEEQVFFHELAHGAHDRINGGLKSGQDPFQEIVAELSGQALCRIAGRRPTDTLGNSYRYIETYAKKANMSPYSACLKAMGETEKVLQLILALNKAESK